MNVIEPKRKGGVISRAALYRKLAGHAERAIEILAEEMEKPSRMSGVRVGAAKVILNKVLPDLKATDVTSGGKEIQTVIVPSEILNKYAITPNSESGSEGQSQI